LRVDRVLLRFSESTGWGELVVVTAGPTAAVEKKPRKSKETKVFMYSCIHVFMYSCEKKQSIIHALYIYVKIGNISYYYKFIL
jgi:hypothetical protein